MRDFEFDDAIASGLACQDRGHLSRSAAPAPKAGAFQADPMRDWTPAGEKTGCQTPGSPRCVESNPDFASAIARFARAHEPLSLSFAPPAQDGAPPGAVAVCKAHNGGLMRQISLLQLVDRIGHLTKQIHGGFSCMATKAPAGSGLSRTIGCASWS